MVACGGEDKQVVQLEATVESMSRSIETLETENIELTERITVLRERLEDRETQNREMEQANSKSDWDLSDKEQWAKNEDTKSSDQQGTIIDRTIRLVQDSGGEIHLVDHQGRQDRTVLVTPLEFVDGQTPLIVSLHGFGGDSAYQSMYIPLHERVNSDGFALLLPNGIRNAQDSLFWNPTDECCQGGKSGEDDVAYLTELVAEAEKIKDFGPIFFFGYSNGGFMSHHMACKGLPGLRAVASLAGTSYVDDSSCDGAPLVSVLHIHGTEDSVIRYEGDETENAFYASAQDMVTRWSRKSGCDWPENPQPYNALDLDEYVPGAETQAFRLEPTCTHVIPVKAGISIELWKGIGSSHAPAYGETFLNALLEWLLAQK